MDMNVIISRLSKSLDGFDQNVREELDDSYFFEVAKRAVMISVQELRVPFKEVDITMVVGERAINLPTDFMECPDEAYPLRVSPSGATTEGDPIALVPDMQMFN